MTKIKRTVTLSSELDNIIAMLASGANQNTSEFIEYRLREDEQIKRMVQKIRNAKDPPEYKMRKKLTA
jgi:Arc/MetJ-type ribon-helix-helix transcriptional regulator